MATPSLRLRLQRQSDTRQIAPGWRPDLLIVLSCTIIGVLGILFSFTFFGERLTIFIALFSLVTPATIGVIAAKRGGMLDPVAVFSFSYAAYNGLILLRFVFLEPFDFPYPFTVNAQTLWRAAIISSTGTLGLAVGWLLPKVRERNDARDRTSERCAAAFSTGVAFFFIGLFFYALQYQQLGGYTNALAIDRVDRFDMMKETVSTPYVAFVIVGLVFMFYGSISRSRRRTIWSLIAVVVWSVAVGLQGDRRLILQVLMGVGLVVGVIKPSITRFRPWAFVAILFGLFVALLFGQYRPLMTLFISRGMTVGEVVDLATEHASATWILPEHTEFGQPYVSILELSRKKQELKWGSSYLTSLPAVLPRALYPGKKAIAPSELLASSLHSGLGAPMGWGYTPVAEAYSNFGLPGTFFILCGWSIFFVWLARIRYCGMGGLVIAAILVQEAVNVNRIDFRSVYAEGIFCVVAGGAALLCVSIILWSTKGSTGTIKNLDLTAASSVKNT